MNESAARTRLHIERGRLSLELAALRRGLDLDDPTGSLPPFEAYGQHPTDLASDTLEREIDRSLELSLLGQLDEIDRAEQRLDEGRYGTCTACGCPIGATRLAAVPWTEFCVTHQAANERRDDRVLDPAAPFALLEETTESDDEDDHTEPPSEELAIHIEHERTRSSQRP